MIAGIKHAVARVGVGRARETHGKEVKDEFCASHVRVAVYEASVKRDPPEVLSR